MLIACCFFVCCVSEHNQKPMGNFTNPNGDSELALVMKDMFDQHMKVKKAVMNDEEVDFPIMVGNYHTLDATEPEKVQSTEYKAFAQSYTDLLTQLNDHSDGDIIHSHNAVVQSCMNCHTALCPGPKVKIKRLFIPEPH